MKINKTKIIIADDNEISAAYLGIFLKRMGFSPMHVKTGLELLRMLKNEKPDAVMLDIGMKSIDGISVLKSMKKDKRLSQIPVIMVSGDESPETIKECRELGCAGYLTKPVKIEKLHEALEGCFFSRREYVRASVNKEVIVTHNGTDYSLYSETLSEGGIYMKKKEPFQVGTEVEVTLSFWDRGPMRLKGTVVHVTKPSDNDSKGMHGMGIKFKGHTDSEVKILKEYIERLITEGA